MARTVGVVLGRQVRVARRRRGWSEAELAVRARVSRSTVGKVERGVGTVAPAAVLEVCWLLEVPVLGVADLQGAEALLRQVEADLLLTRRRMRARKGEVPSSAF